MKKLFAFTFQEKIWNIQLGEHHLVAELRNETLRKVELICIDLVHAVLIWKQASPINTWWQSLGKLNNNLVELIEFSEETKPQVTQKHYLNILTGELTEYIPQVPDNFSSQTYRYLQPVHYTEQNEHFPAIHRFLYRLLNVDIQKGVDYLEYKDKIIISYYLYQENKLWNYLLVVNNRKEVLLNELLTESEGLGLGTFTVKPEILLYVKNKSQLHGYELN
ncbi:hypothetical protein QM480_12300 [Flectobacillus sp. DC10W]|uniref:DUF4905 domain-containing protein n=1 Tax=Flectobacillus longus TaxID=2984207 RepID=A0ABT6YND4_9BACT|nr:DUF4905 domain-containing protein [Flectobacillus longus]MDI9865112.1 hypothetical protein [Flectobacillus longus]